MPLYEYQCDSCDNRFEKIQKFSDPPLDTCPACGGAVKKLLSSPAIQFKGSGWYITDYAKKPAGEAKTGAKPDATSDKSSSDGASDKTAKSDTSSSAPAASSASSSKE